MGNVTHRPADPGTTTLEAQASGAAQPPSPPSSVSAQAGDASATVAWTAAAGNGSTVTEYRVTSTPGNHSCTTTGSRTCTITGLTNGASYTFAVTATNAAGTSSSSPQSPPVVSSCVSGFVDVPSDHVFCSAIGWMKHTGISTGTQSADGTSEYRPTLAVSRQAMAAFLYRTLGSPAFLTPEEATFGDVSTPDPFFDEIEWVAAEGISTGTAQTDGKPLYYPVASVSRQAMGAFLFRAAGSPAFSPPSEPSFADVGSTHPFFKEIEWLRAAGSAPARLSLTASPCTSQPIPCHGRRWRRFSSGSPLGSSRRVRGH